MKTLWLIFWFGFIGAIAFYFVVALVLYWRDVRRHR
jgi:hypothetical protein